MTNALLVAFIYWFGQVADNWLGWQTITRPIVFGPLAGLLCGDITTGIIIGAELEAVYMGVSAIGGEMPSNYQAATVLCVGFVVLSGADMGTGLALAITVGALINVVKPFTQALSIALHPWSMSIAETGNYKKFRLSMWVQVLFVSQLIPTIVVFFVALGGEVGLQAFINSCPAFILKGLEAAGNMLVVVGLCLTTQAIWNGTTTVMYVLLGFVLVKYLGLGTLPIAIIGLVIAFAHYMNKNELLNTSKSSPSTGGAKGDDFYG